MPTVLRLFVSSTFSDMMHERRLLQQRVFPQLREMCRERGVMFQAVDLRWGVNEASQYEQRTMEICLSEVERCQHISPRCNFLTLVGDRYGWQPNPTRIPKGIFEEILGQLGEEQQGPLKEWYRLDENALAQEYVLRVRSEEIDWWPISLSIKESLRSGIESAGWTQDDPRRALFYASATHQEIINGVFSPPAHVPDSREHVFCFLREIEGLPQDKSAHSFLDMGDDGQPDKDAHQSLSQLKDQLREHFAEEGGRDDNVVEYTARWLPDGGKEGRGDIRFDEEAFVEAMLTRLTDLLRPQLEELNEQDEASREQEAHEEFRRQGCAGFVGRTALLGEIDQWLQEPQAPVLSLLGESGRGKSALLARVATTLREEQPEKVSLVRFVGVTPDSIELVSLLRSLNQELLKAYEDSQELATEPEEVLEQFSQLLSLAREDKPLIVLLDALDQLSSPEARRLDWLPTELPPHVHLLVSALPSLEERLDETRVLEVTPMSVESGELLLAQWLAGVGRTLQAEQKDAILSHFANNGLPLYLRLAFERARLWRSDWGVPELGSSVEELVSQTFAALEKEHTVELVETSMAYLRAGKHGLTEAELLDAVSLDEPYFTGFKERSYHELPEERLPTIVWSRLYLDIEAYLTERSADGTAMLDFFYRQFANHIDREYFPEGQRAPRHRVLAHYFAAQELFEDGNERQLPNLRKLSEQAFQQRQGELWEDLTATLSDFDTLMARCQAGQIYPQQEEYDKALEALDETYRAQLQPWEQFFRTEIHLIARGDRRWPAHKILLQLASEHAEDHPVTQAADRFLAEGKARWLWLRRTSRPATSQGGSSLRTYDQHRGWLKGAALLDDERFVSWSKDRTLRVWDRVSGKVLAHLHGHKGVVLGALVLDDGASLLSWSQDGTLRLWNTEDGSEQGCFSEHSKPIQGALVVDDGRFLSWSEDKTLRLWNRKGEQLVSFEGHRRSVQGAHWLPDHLISWSPDRSLRVWTHEGEEIRKLTGHTGEMIDACVLRNGRLLSWSKDHTLRLWEWESGEEMAVLEGHKAWVDGALELSDGRLLSWSRDKTLRLWTAEGHVAAVLKDHTLDVKGAIELNDGRLLSWSKDQTLRLWSSDGKSLAVLEGHYGRINGALEWEEEDALLTWAGDSTLRLWDRTTGHTRGLFLGHKAEIYNAALVAGGTQFLSWSQDMALRLWGVANLVEEEGQLQGHRKWVKGVVRVDDQRVASWDNEGRLLLWDAEKGELEKELQGHNKAILRAERLEEGPLASWSSDGTVRFWPMEEEEEAVVVDCDGTIEDARLSRQKLMVWTKNGNIRVLAQDGQKQMEVNHEGRVLGARYLPEERLLTWSGSKDNSIRVWNAEGECEVTFQHDKAVNGVRVLEDGRLLSWSTDKTLRLWSTDSEEAVATFKGHTHKVNRARLLSGDRILSWANDKTLRIWDMEGNELQVLKGHDNKEINGALELDNGQLLAWCRNKSVYWWDLEQPETPWVFPWERFMNEHRNEWRLILQSRTAAVHNERIDVNGTRQGASLYMEQEQDDFLHLQWHQVGEWKSELLDSNGRAVLRYNKDLALLGLHFGQHRVDLEQAMEILTDGPERLFPAPIPEPEVVEQAETSPLPEKAQPSPTNVSASPSSIPAPTEEGESWSLNWMLLGLALLGLLALWNLL